MQKFLRGHRVKIADDLGHSMRHFESGTEAIVDGSYSDLVSHWGDGVNETYSLLLLGDHQNLVSWYHECQLTLISSDRDNGERLLQEYKAKRWQDYLEDSERRSHSSFD